MLQSKGNNQRSQYCIIVGQINKGRNHGFHGTINFDFNHSLNCSLKGKLIFNVLQNNVNCHSECLPYKYD